MERAFKPKTSMPNSELIIQCSNPNCVASNKLEAELCHVCKTPTVKRYLWAIREVSLSEPAAQLIGDRYVALSTRIFLDTKPSQSPQIPKDIPPEIVTYLQLFPLYPHIPQVYGQLEGTDVWLLDYGTVPVNKTDCSVSPPIPTIAKLWQKATALQQIMWLRQLAKLWQPLREKQVVSSLLTPQAIGINGSLVQLIQLEFDRGRSFNLQDLGRTWKQLTKFCASEIAEAVERLCELLEIGTIDTVTQLVAVLDRGIDVVSSSYQYSYKIYSITDAGPNRRNNQDAVYPAQGSLVEVNKSDSALTIVCDGVGGHEGGEIAATETIEQLRSRILEPNFAQENSTPAAVIQQLKRFINSTNDALSARNDREQRQERQRMGTTLVLSLARAHEIYLAHVGDSRIYWITPNSCHQLTIDDDLASREVRLGYAIYRDSLQFPSAGALIQAIGMRDSIALHPNVCRQLIDRDCIFLLCTDGLSDFDRVEQYWKKVFLPVFRHKKDISSAAKTLIRIANEKNGHDNATVAIVHCRVKPKPSSSKIRLSWLDIEPAIDEATSNTEMETVLEPVPKTEVANSSAAIEKETSKAKDSPKLLKSIALILTILVSVIALFYLFLENEVKNKVNTDDPEIAPEVPESQSR